MNGVVTFLVWWAAWSVVLAGLWSLAGLVARARRDRVVERDGLDALERVSTKVWL